MGIDSITIIVILTKGRFFRGIITSDDHKYIEKAIGKNYAIHAYTYVRASVGDDADAADIKRKSRREPTD